MLKKLLFISTLLIFTTSIFAMTLTEIKPEMANKIDKVLMILKDSNLEKSKKAEEIINLMDSTFDYSLMSRLSLGKAWKTLSTEEKNQFTELFTQKLKSSYVEKLDLYTDELVEILGTETIKKNRVRLKTQLIGKNEKYDINYKFYKKRDENTWLIYDVDLIGVSIIQTYRKQFSGFLKEKSIDDLLSHLKKKQ